MDGIRKVKQKLYTNNFSKANRIIVCVNNCMENWLQCKNQGAGGKRIGQSVGRKPCQQQPRLAQDKQLQKIVQQTLKCQCLKLGERKHSSHTTHYHATAFKHKLMSNSLRYYASSSPHLPTTEERDLKILIKLLSVPDNSIRWRGKAPYFGKVTIKQQVWWR